MWYFKRAGSVLTGIACFVVASTVMAQQSQKSAPAAPAVVKPHEGETKAKQSAPQPAAPAVPPQAAAQNKVEEKSPTPATSEGQKSSGQHSSQKPSAANSIGGTKEATPGISPQQRKKAAVADGRRVSERASLGVNVVDDEQGVVVTRIRRGTPAERMGLQPGDRILSVNGHPVIAVDEFIAAIRGMNAGDEVQLLIDRRGDTRDIVGRLIALRDVLAAGEGPVRSVAERAREILGRERDEWAGEAGPGGANVQAGYEEGGRDTIGVPRALEARITRLEKQIDQLTRDVHQLQVGMSLRQSEPASTEQKTDK